MTSLEVVLVLVLMMSVAAHMFQFMVFKDMQWLKDHHAEEVQRCWKKIDHDLYGIPRPPIVRLVKDE